MRKLIALSNRITSLRNISATYFDLSIKSRNYSRLNLLTTTSDIKSPDVFSIFGENNKIHGHYGYYKIENGKQFSTTCALAKGKNRVKEKKKTDNKRPIDTREMSEVVDIEQLTKQCEKQVEIFKNNLIKHASLRPTSGAIEELSVSYDGTTYALHELANIVRKSNVIVITITDFPQVIPNILESFKRHEMNLNPQQDGTTIYITLPKITRELRQSLVKSTTAIFIKTRDNIKDIRNKLVKKLKKNDENHPMDLIERVQNNVEAFTQRYIDEAAEILEKKQKELQGEAGE